MDYVSQALLERGITKQKTRHDYTTPNKACSKCKKEFPRTNKYFRKESARKDGLSYLCKSCASAIGKKSRLKHIDRHMAYTKSPEFVFSQLKHQAKKRNITFSITLPYYLEHLAFASCCYCGSNNTKHLIDRFVNDHAIGYTEKNSVPCCELCNKMKSHHDPDTFIKQCSSVHLHNQKS